MRRRTLRQLPQYGVSLKEPTRYGATLHMFSMPTGHFERRIYMALSPLMSTYGFIATVLSSGLADHKQDGGRGFVSAN